MLIVLAMIAAGALVGWFVRGSDPSAARSERGADRTGRAPERNRAPGRGLLPGNRRAPTAADVLGALRGAPSGDLVRIEGRVVDAISREPVPDVEVVFAGAAGETAATAAGDGTYQVDVPRGEYRAFVRGDFVISVGAAPWERLPSPPDPTAASAPDEQLAPLVEVTTAQRGVDLEVQQSGVVIGRVLDGTGRPVVGAVVRAAVGPWRPVLGTHIAESGADGGFRLEVPGGYYDLEAAHPDFAGPELIGMQRPNVMVYPRMETTIDLTLASGCVITGRAIRRDGSPAGAGALERGNGVDFWPAGPIADDGTFRFAIVGEEEVHLRAWPWKAPPAPAQAVMCRDGARHVVEFVVPDTAPDLTGRITDAAGDPVAGAFIDVYGLGPGTMNQQERADSAGDWAVFALPPGDYAVTAHVPGLGVASTTVSVPGRDVALRLSGTGALEGRVLGVADGTTFQLDIAGCMSSQGAVVMQATTRVVPVFGGTYRVDNLPACQLAANARSPKRSAMVQATIVAGRVASFDLDLSPPRSKTVRVSVADSDGDAVAGAQVIVAHLDGGGAVPTDTTTTDGRGQTSVEAHVGDVITAFSYGDPGDPDSMPLMGQYTVSDAAGSTEEADLVLQSQGGYWDP